MHTLLHLAIRVIFMVVIGILFTLFVAIRPGAKKLSRGNMIGLFVVGVVIAVVFISTQSLYEVQSAL